MAAVAEFTQTPPDLMAGGVALAALSGATGGRARVQIRPGRWEPVNLFTVVAMPPGSRKSAVFAAMTAPLLAAEQTLAELAAPLITEAELAQRTAQRDAERHANGAANARQPGGPGRGARDGRRRRPGRQADDHPRPSAADPTT